MLQRKDTTKQKMYGIIEGTKSIATQAKNGKPNLYHDIYQRNNQAKHNYGQFQTHQPCQKQEVTKYLNKREVSKYLPSGVLLKSLLDGDEILEALRHLKALDVQVTRV